MEKELSRKTMHEALEEICDSILEDLKGDRGSTDSWVFVHTRLMSLEVELIDLFASHIEETEDEEWGDKKDIESMLKEILDGIDDLFKKPDYQEYASDDYGWQYDKEIKNRFLSKLSNEGIIRIHSFFVEDVLVK